MAASTTSIQNSPIAQGGDFLRLGLRRGECSANVIRQAVQKSVRRLVRSSPPDKSIFDRQLGLIAASAYRILDPRYRAQLYERVQLTYALDRDEIDSETTSAGDLWNIPETAILTPAFETPLPVRDREEDRGATLNQAREIVRAVRQIDSAEKFQAKGAIFHWRLRLLTWLSVRAR